MDIYLVLFAAVMMIPMFLGIGYSEYQKTECRKVAIQANKTIEEIHEICR